MSPSQRIFVGILSAMALIALSMLMIRSFPAKPSYRLDLEQFKASDRQFESSQQVVKAELGYRLFRETALSLNGKVSCESCHLEEASFADTKAFSEGLATTQLNAPALVNLGFQEHFFWDGRIDSLAAQALEPVENPEEHGFSRLGVAYVLLKKHSELYDYAFGAFPSELAAYLEGFDEPPQAYPARPVTLSTLPPDQQRLLAPQNPQWVDHYNQLSSELKEQLEEVFLNFGRALAWYQKGLLAINSPFDDFLATYQPGAEEQSFSDRFGAIEWQGLQLFLGKAGCIRCHSGPMLSDGSFHFTAIAANKSPGRLAGVRHYDGNPYRCLDKPQCQPRLAGGPSDATYQQRTPSLRNVAMTAPYMHDGSIPDLRAVIERYNHPPAHQGQDPRIAALHLSPEDLAALEAFLRSLSSPVRDLGQEWAGY